MERLYEKLMEYGKKDIYPFHMPGHKRNVTMLPMENPYGYDITEIDGFDSLQEAQDLILDSMDLASRLYHAKWTHYLVNGSTVGLLAAIAACTKRGDRILVARNCHKAVYNALYLNELEPIFIYPQVNEEFGINCGISPKEIRQLLITHSDIRAVVLTSPTYEGILSDIPSIAAIVHQWKIPLIVDEAHGAHLGFHNKFPNNAVQAGADLVIHSVHKTMPSFTQTALLHNNGEFVSKENMKRYVNMYQSTSPSYLFMSSIDRCMEMIEKQGEELFERYCEKLNWFYEEMKQLRHLHLLTKQIVEPFAFDYGKLIVSTRNTTITGHELYRILLEKYQLQMEMESKDYVIGMTSICDTWEGMKRLAEALKEIDNSIQNNSNSMRYTNGYCVPVEVEMTYYAAMEQETESILLKHSVGRISGEMIYLYPPGIPFLVPGERISTKVIEKLDEYMQSGLEIKGLQDPDKKSICVIKEK